MVIDILTNYKKNEIQLKIAQVRQQSNESTRKLENALKIADLCIESLPEDLQMVADCYFRKGLSLSDIARKFGYAKTTIQKRKERAVELIAEMFTR